MRDGRIEYLIRLVEKSDIAELEIWEGWGRRIRIGAHCLRRVVGPNHQLPFTADARQLAADLDVSAEAVDATVADLVRRGVGSLQDHHWQIDTPEQVSKLVEALCAYADSAL